MGKKICVALIVAVLILTFSACNSGPALNGGNSSDIYEPISEYKGVDISMLSSTDFFGFILSGKYYFEFELYLGELRYIVDVPYTAIIAVDGNKAYLGLKPPSGYEQELVGLSFYKNRNKIHIASPTSKEYSVLNANDASDMKSLDEMLRNNYIIGLFPGFTLPEHYPKKVSLDTDRTIPYYWDDRIEYAYCEYEGVPGDSWAKPESSDFYGDSCLEYYFTYRLEAFHLSFGESYYDGVSLVLKDMHGNPPASLFKPELSGYTKVDLTPVSSGNE